MATDIVAGGLSVLESHMAALLADLTKDLADAAAEPVRGPVAVVVEAPVPYASSDESDAPVPTASTELIIRAPGTGTSAPTTSPQFPLAAPETGLAAPETGAPAATSVPTPPTESTLAAPETGAPAATSVPTSSTELALAAPARPAGPPVAPRAGVDRTGDAVDALDRILDDVTSLTDTQWHEVDGNRLHRAVDILEQLDRRLGGLRANILTTAEANGLWAVGGQRTFKSWLRTRTDATPGAASHQVHQARGLRDYLPLAREALESGRISREHVNILIREAIRTDRLRAQLADEELGEAFLVKQAERMDAGTFAKLVKHWAITVDPDAADRAWRDATTKEQFSLSRTLDGYHLAGWLDELSGQVVDAALRSHMGRKAKDDDRTPAQRRAAALTSLARQSLDSGEQGAHSRIRPHVTVTTSLETLRALAAATGSPVPPQRPDGTPHVAGAAFGFPAEASFSAVGGPRDPGRPEDPFELSAEARQWIETWAPGDDHVISTAIDPTVMIGVEPATLEDGTPISPAMLARLACDSGLSRVVFGPDSTILDVGREQRIFPAHMVKAIIARDKHCQVPDCDEPPGFGEIHHSLQWYRDGGATCVEHGILLCWHHHDWVHAYGITIVRSHGRWYFYNRHGQLITGQHEQA